MEVQMEHGYRHVCKGQKEKEVIHFQFCKVPECTSTFQNIKYLQIFRKVPSKKDVILNPWNWSYPQFSCQKTCSTKMTWKKHWENVRWFSSLWSHLCLPNETKKMCLLKNSIVILKLVQWVWSFSSDTDCTFTPSGYVMMSVFIYICINVIHIYI